MVRTRGGTSISQLFKLILTNLGQTFLLASCGALIPPRKSIAFSCQLFCRPCLVKRLRLVLLSFFIAYTRLSDSGRSSLPQLIWGAAQIELSTVVVRPLQFPDLSRSWYNTELVSVESHHYWAKSFEFRGPGPAHHKCWLSIRGCTTVLCNFSTQWCLFICKFLIQYHHRFSIDISYSLQT
jgi:hypothetical protein